MKALLVLALLSTSVWADQITVDCKIHASIAQSTAMAIRRGSSYEQLRAKFLALRQDDNGQPENLKLFRLQAWITISMTYNEGLSVDNAYNTIYKRCTKSNLSWQVVE